MALTIKENYELLAAEYERLADEKIKISMAIGVSPEQKMEAMEAARVYYQLANEHSKTVVNAVTVRPPKFTGQNTGMQNKIQKRIKFLKGVWATLGEVQHQEIVRYICDNNLDEAKRLWPDNGKDKDIGSRIMRFIKRHRKSI